jgi:cysteine-rich repeat protein
MKAPTAPALLLVLLAPSLFAQPLPTGPEFQVGSGIRTFETFPDVASDAAGDFVVVWDTHPLSVDTNVALPLPGGPPLAQRFDAAGVPQGTPIPLGGVGAQAPRVAMTSSGTFVVAWMGGPGQVLAQRFDGTGTPQGAPFQVNVSVAAPYPGPTVALDGAGDFVVTWIGLDGGGRGIFARRYDSGGTPQGGEFLVNTTTTNEQITPRVAADGAGDFVIVWDGITGNEDIFGRAFTSTGAPVGGEFQVNVVSAFTQSSPDVAVNGGGTFFVTWTTNNQDGAFTGIFGRRFDATGTPLGGEFQVNALTTGYQFSSAVTADAADNFIVLWTALYTGGVGDGSNDTVVRGRRFAGTGAPLGGDFQVNTYTPSAQEAARVAALGGDNFVATWHSQQDNVIERALHVFAQRFTTACGDGVVDAGEQCDDGNHTDGDGCHHNCQREECTVCTGAPSACTPITTCTNADGCCAPGCTDSNDDDCPTLIGGARLVIKDGRDLLPPPDPGHRDSLVFVSHDPALDTSDATGIDPTTDGAFLQVYGPSSGQAACFRLEDASSPIGVATWAVSGSSPSARRLAYSDPDRANGSCRLVRMTGGRVLTVSCRDIIGYDLFAATQGSVAVRFRSGPTEYCTVFGGTIAKDRRRDTGFPGRSGIFSARNASSPTSCPPPPVSCP